MAEPTVGRRLDTGTTVAPHRLESLSGDSVGIPDPDHLIHLQLRRFAGCPVCNLHLRSFVVRNNELTGAGVREVVVFHSTAEDLRKYQAELPFDVIPDPQKKLYAEFGVEARPMAILSPRAWPAIFRGLGRSISAVIRGREHAPPVKPEGGSLGLPGDFLIAADGRVVASKYGTHAYDQWTVDEVLALVRDAGSATGAADTPSAPSASVGSS
jgi:AhpC/TSA antioxidant enzyme